MRIVTALIFALAVGYHPLFAYEPPFNDFTIQGIVMDWATKKPLPDVQILVFLNGSPYADSTFVDIDYPNFPHSGIDGVFLGKASYALANEKIRKVEIIGFCKGYRTERFTFSISEFTVKKEGELNYKIEIPQIHLLKTEK